MKLGTSLAILISLLASRIEVNTKPTQVLDSSLEINNGINLPFDNQSLSTDNEVLVKRSNASLQKISDINYEESLSEINNPYRGTFKQMKIYLRRNGGSKSQSLQNTHLLRVLVDISDFRKNSFDSAAIKYLKEMLAKFRSNGKTIIIRFGYDDDFNGGTTYEPRDMSIVMGHQESLRSVFEEYQDVVASVECGLFGKWGEMHGSTVYPDDSDRIKYINKVITKWLDVLPKSITVTVRTPKFYCDWSGVNRSNIHKDLPKSNEDRYRVGMYNDGYLGSYDDIGTYKDREKELNWLFNQGNHTLFGGEFGNYSGQNMGSTVKHTAKYMSVEAFKTHTSYLNNEFYENTINHMKNEVYEGPDKRYKNQKGFTYIQNHLGYRFVVRGVRLTKNAYKNNKFGIEVDIENVGFATLIKPKTVSFVVVDSKGNSNILSMKNVKDGNPNLWYSREKHTLKGEASLPSNLSTGNCKIYLRIASNSQLGLDGYPIQFANDGKNIWDSKLGANYLGSFTLNNGGNGGSTTPENTNTFITVKFKGTLDPTLNYYLGVPELKELVSFDIHKENDENSAKYRTWHVTSEKSPSFLYLSEATYGNNGNPSKYCLDLGKYVNDDGYNYLSIVECSKAQHKFRYGASNAKTIDVYDKNDKHLVDKNGNQLCVYYSMTPRVDKCSNSKNSAKMNWDKYVLTESD